MMGPSEIETIVLSPEGSSCDQEPDIEFISEMRADDLPSSRITKDIIDKERPESPKLYPKDCLVNEDVEVLRPNNMVHIYAYSPTQYSVQENESIILGEKKHEQLASNYNHCLSLTNENTKNAVPDPEYKIKTYEISDDDDTDEGLNKSPLSNKVSKINHNSNQAKNISNVEQNENMKALSEDIIIIDEDNSSADSIIYGKTTAYNTGKANKRINIHKRSKDDAIVVGEKRLKQDCYAKSASPISLLDSYYEDLEKDLHTEDSYLEFPDYEDDHISCEFCSKIFISLNELTLHECIRKKQLEYFNNNVHKFEEPSNKSHCQMFSWFSVLEQELPTKRRLEIKPKLDQQYVSGKDDQIYNCHLCENTIRGRANLRLHVRQHRLLRDTRLYCLYCDKAFSINKDLKRHIIAIHQSKKLKINKYTFNSCKTISNTEDKRAQHMAEHDTDVVAESLVLLNEIQEKIPLGKSSDVEKSEITIPMPPLIVTKDSPEVLNLPLVLPAKDSVLNVNGIKNAGDDKKVINVSPMIDRNKQMSVTNITSKVPEIILNEESLEYVGLNELNVHTSSGVNLNEIQVCDFTEIESHADIVSMETTPLYDNNIENKLVKTNTLTMNLDPSPPRNIERPMVDFRETSIVEETISLVGFDVNNIIDNLHQLASPRSISDEKKVTDTVKSYFDDEANILAGFDLDYLDDDTNNCAKDNDISGNQIHVGHFSKISANQEMLELVDLVESNFPNESSEISISDQPNIVICSDTNASITNSTTLSSHSVTEQHVGNKINCDSQNVVTASGDTNNESLYFNDLIKFMEKTTNEIKASMFEHMVPGFEDTTELTEDHNKIPAGATAPEAFSAPNLNVNLSKQNTQQIHINQPTIARPLHNNFHNKKAVPKFILPAQEIANNILSTHSSKIKVDGQNIKQTQVNNQIFARALQENGNTGRSVQNALLPAQQIANQSKSKVKADEQNTQETRVNKEIVARPLYNKPIQHVLLPAQHTILHNYSSPSSKVKVNKRSNQKIHINQDAVLLALQNKVNNDSVQHILLPTQQTSVNTYNATTKVEVIEHTSPINQDAVMLALQNKVDSGPAQHIILPAKETAANTYNAPAEKVKVNEQNIHNNQINQETVVLALQNKVNNGSVQHLILPPAQETASNIYYDTPNAKVEVKDQNTKKNQLQNTIYSGPGQHTCILLPAQPEQNVENRTITVVEINQYILNGVSDINAESVASGTGDKNNILCII